MKKFLSLALAVMMVLSTLLVFSACGDETTKAEDNKPNEDKKTLTMATNATFPPYEYMENGKMVGIDVEVAQKIAEKLNMNLVIKDVDFGSICSGVESGKYDMGMAGMTVLPDRLKQVSFSNSYATGVQVVIVNKDSDIKTIDDLKGKKIGVQQDTTGDIYATDEYGEENITRFKAATDTAVALASKKVDAVIVDKGPGETFVKTNDGLQILEAEFANEQYAIAVNKENKELLKQINDALAELTKDGTIAAIIEKYIPSNG